MDVTGRTKIFGIFGFPVEHTLSPSMHNAAFKALGLDMCYLPFKVHPADLPRAIEAIRALNISGVNITVPHKEKVIPFLDETDREASLIGAVNTVVNREGKLSGYNTDGRGFVKSLEEAKITTEGKKVLLVGAGGAARAIAFSLAMRGVTEIAFFDIDKEKARELSNAVQKTGIHCSVVNEIMSLSGFHIVINATPLGLKADDPLPFSPQLILPDTVVCDLIYKKTALLHKAEGMGAKTIDGSGMLLWQGVLAFELWTGIKPPVDVMRKALLSGI